MGDLDDIRVAAWPKSGPGSWAYPPTPGCIEAEGVPQRHPAIPLRMALGDHDYTPTEDPEGFADLLFNGVQIDESTEEGWYRIGKRYVDLDTEPDGSLVFVSLDFDRTTHKDKSATWQDIESAQAACDAFGALGFVAKASPNGLHAFIRPPEPIPLVVASAYVRLIRDWAHEKLGAVLKTHGLKPADPLDWQQGLRIGRCIRLDGKAGPWGTDRPPMCLAPAEDGRWVTEWRPSLGSLTPQKPTRHFAPADDMPLPWPAPPEGWSDWVRATESLPHDVIEALDRGTPVTEPGDRDESILRIVASLAAQLRSRTTRDQLFGILAPSLAADDVVCLEKAWRHICNYHEGIVKSPDGTTELTPDGRPYVWRLGSSRGWYVSLPDGGHLEVGAEVLVSETERVWSDIELRNDKGRAYGPDAINALYGRTARSLVYDHGATLDRFDFASLAYTAGVGQMPDIPAEHSADCEEFCALFGPRFLDWVAVFGMRDAPCAALILKGQHSNGKGMIVAALRIVAGGGCSLREALHPQFQQARTRRGGWFVSQNEKSATENDPDAVKALVDDETHEIQIKGKNSVTVRGYTRTLVTTNKPDPFNMIARMNSDADDIAIGLRMLIVDIEQSDVPDPRQPGAYLGVPAAWLHRRGGSAYTREGADPWVGTPEAPGRLVRYFRWLMAHREVVPGERLLVEGDTTSWRASEASKSERNSRVLDGIVMGLVAGKPVGERTAAGLYLNVSAYRESWDGIHQDHGYKPSLRTIGEVLNQCAFGVRTRTPIEINPKRPDRRFVSFDALAARADDLGITVDSVQQALAPRQTDPKKELDAVRRMGQLFGNRPQGS